MMTNSHFLRHLLSAVMLAAFFLLATGSEFTWTATTAMINKPVDCQGTVADCTADVFDIETEFNRRILQGTERYISYGSLQANNVPCSRKGASYYNCQPGAEANPYERTCSAATQCRS